MRFHLLHLLLPCTLLALLLFFLLLLPPPRSFASASEAPAAAFASSKSSNWGQGGPIAERSSGRFPRYVGDAKGGGGGTRRRGGSSRHSSRTDVCKTGRHKCDRNAVCKTLRRFHRCSCKKGWEGNGRTCTDVDECRLRNGGCVHLCRNLPGNYSCACHPGFAPDPMDAHNCVDVDECQSRHGCQHGCRNLIGSFVCTCPSGMTLAADARTCRSPEFESASCRAIQCQELCLVSGGGAASCACREGSVLVSRKQCRQTCAVGNGGCQHHCHQTPSGTACTCHPKYLLASDGHSCVPSCAINNGGCSRKCHNTATGVRCSCPPGYSLLPDHRSCRDIDECEDDNGGCQYSCVNNVGSYECICPAGYKLEPDEHSCRDVDECQVPGTCEGRCANSPGSFQCDCRRGYQLFGRAHCGDTNECSIENGGCSHECHNSEGSWHCSCREGHKLHANGMDCVKIDKCPHLRNPAKAEMSCYVLGDLEGDLEEKCTVKCQEGTSFAAEPKHYHVYTCGAATGYTWAPDPRTEGSNTSLLSCSTTRARPGYKRKARLLVAMEGSRNGTTTTTTKGGSLLEGLIHALDEKMSFFSDQCQLRFISEKPVKHKRPKKNLKPGQQMMSATFEVMSFPPLTTPADSKCNLSCLQRRTRKSLYNLILYFKTMLWDHRNLTSLSGQQYEVMPRSFKARRKVKVACPRGHVLVGAMCVACSVGSYHNVKADKCLVCPSGTYQDHEARTGCHRCPNRMAVPPSLRKPGARNLSECFDACPSGYWSPNGFSPCRPCPPGTFQPGKGRVECLSCPSNLATLQSGSTSIAECILPAGATCAPGHYYNTTTKACVMCPLGYYQPLPGSFACVQCPSTSTTDYVGSTSLEDCKRHKCGGYVHKLQGIFESPNYPGNYPNNARCTWVVKPRKGRRVLVVVPSIALSHDQCGDYLVMRKSKSPYSRVTFETCTSVTRPVVFASTSRRLWVQFRSDANGTAGGFKIPFVTYNVEYQRLIQNIIRDSRLYSLHNHVSILKDRELLPRLLEVVAEPIKYYAYARQKHKLFPASFIRLLTRKVKRFFSYRRR
ncbi:signal peptide, CUB and EGF-like domain-containing protein 3 [Oratosquilla oratoria]|uniref:signal peptide, CUB and EGF-like domain-containing protein 3 n=1 Tax=Oratosquilla oratoria TaxID=337810 RepID=UPI003F760A8E